MLVEGQLASSLKTFIENLNTTTQEDKDAVITLFCNEIETLIYAAIKSVTIIIQPGTIIVEGANTGGPVIANNQLPLTLTNTLE